MTTLIIIQLILAIALVVLVLLQGSDNEGLGLGGGTFGGMMSARGSANLLSRLTAATATLFMVMSVVLMVHPMGNFYSTKIFLLRYVEHELLRYNQ